MRIGSMHVAGLALCLVVAPLGAQGPTRAPLADGEHDVVVNGVRLWYRVAGKTTRAVPPVVFLHGGPGYNSESFMRLEGPRLEKSLRMVYLDQRGSGRSERPWTKHYALDTLVADLEALRRTLGAPTLALIGHSFGTILALEYAARYPEHVSRMVLVGTPMDLQRACAARLAKLRATHASELTGIPIDTVDSAGVRRDMCEVSFGLEGRALGDRRQAFNDEAMFPDSTKRRMQDSVDAASGLRNTGELSNALFNGGLTRYHFDRASRVTMPVLVIAGREDYAIGVEQQRDLARLLPRATLSEYERAGHFVYLDEPERFTREVSAFLGKR